MRRGASWTAEDHPQPTVAAVARPVRSSVVPSPSVLLRVLVVARPAGVCPAERPAGIQRSGVIAVVDTARTPAMASVAGRCPACGVHPSGVVVRGPAVRLSGVQPVRCPVTWGRRPGVRRSGRLLSTRPMSSPLMSTRPVSSRLVSAPVGPDASVSSHTGRWRWDQAGAAGQPSPQEPVEVPVGCRAVERLGRRPRRLGGGRRCRGRALVSGGR
jgi:hypothetical protein